MLADQLSGSVAEHGFQGRVGEEDESSLVRQRHAFSHAFEHARLQPQLLLGAALLADVAQEDGELGRTFVLDGDDGNLDQKLLAGGPQGGYLTPLPQHAAFACGQIVGHARPMLRAQGDGDEQLTQILAQHGGLAVPERSLGCWVEVNDATTVVDGDNAIEGGFENGPRVGFAGA